MKITKHLGKWKRFHKTFCEIVAHKDKSVFSLIPLRHADIEAGRGEFGFDIKSVIRRGGDAGMECNLHRIQW